MFLGHKPFLQEIAQHISGPAPLLETVTLYATSERGSLELPPIFFEAFLSSVRTLNIRGATLAPGPCKISQLTKFTLETRLKQLTIITLLDLLGEMPLLQLLEVKLDRPGQRDHAPEGRVVTLSHLEEVTITTDERFRVPLASPILPALCLPNVRRVNMRSICPCGAPRVPFLPPAFEERLPSLSTTPEVSFTVGKGFNIEFFGSDRSQLTLCVVDSSIPFTFSRKIFGGTPFDSVLKLHVHFQSRTMSLLFFFEMLQAMERLECLKMKQNTSRALAYWTLKQGRISICPALGTLIVTDADFDNAGYHVQELRQARERARLPIARVEVRHESD
jgi:hypothetical protein